MTAIDKALEAGAAKLARHFTVKMGNQGLDHNGLRYVVFANGELKPEGVMLRHMTEPIKAIEETVDAVIAAYPDGGTMWVRSPLDINRWEDALGDERWPDQKAGLAAHIRFAVEPKA